MSKQRARTAVHSKRADHLGRTKDRRHGTRSWITWVDEDRIAAAGRRGRAAQ